MDTSVLQVHCVKLSGQGHEHDQVFDQSADRFVYWQDIRKPQKVYLQCACMYHVPTLNCYCRVDNSELYNFLGSFKDPYLDSPPVMVASLVPVRYSHVKEPKPATPFNIVVPPADFNAKKADDVDLVKH